VHRNPGRQAQRAYDHPNLFEHFFHPQFAG
jgi:hypothetical protein